MGGNRRPRENLPRETATPGNIPAGTGNHGNSRDVLPQERISWNFTGLHDPPRRPFFFSYFVLVDNRYHIPSGTFACAILDMRLNVGFGRLLSCMIYQVPVSYVSRTQATKTEQNKARHLSFFVIIGRSSEPNSRNSITRRTDHELAHLSCIAQASETYADEPPPIAQAEENMCSSCSSYSSPWENMCR